VCVTSLFFGRSSEIKSFCEYDRFLNEANPQIVQLDESFRQIWFSNFCGEMANVSEIFTQIFNLLKKGAKLKKLETV